MRLYLQLIGIACLITFSACNAKPKQKVNKSLQKPNIVYILADDLGFGDIAINGQQHIKTPHLDALAQEGMQFTQHYSGSTVCAPSRSSLLTGQHTGHTPIRGNKGGSGSEGQVPMIGEAYTVAEMMKENGYITGAFGKWGLGFPGSEGDAINQGFDEFLGYNCQVYAHRYYPTHIRSNEDIFPLEGNDWKQTETYAPDVIQEHTLNFIKTHKDKPFFLYVPFLLPHAELIVPDDTIFQYYADKFDEKPYVGKAGADYGDELRIGGYCSQEKPKATFAAMVTRLDMYVGQIVSELKKQGVYDNTIIMFTSDNGPHGAGGGNPEFFNGNADFRGIKRDLYEGGIRTPFFAVWNGKIKAGSQSDHISAFWDLMPTMADIIDIEKPSTTDGISFLPSLLQNGKQEEHELLYWEFFEQGGKKAIRQGDWKLVALKVSNPKKTIYELYNLKEDKGESNNLAQQEPEKLEELKALLPAQRTPSPLFKFKYEKEETVSQLLQ